MLYATIRFFRTLFIDLSTRTTDQYVYISAYQTITGNYNVDFIIKLFMYFNFLIAW